MNRTPSLVCLLALALASCVTHEQPPSLPSTAERPTFTSTVLSVTDGDTLTVLVNDVREKVRLNGIDCPESDQPFGSQATQLAKQLALEKAVTVTDFGRDKYHRMLGEIVLPDGRMLNRELVREGFCWWYRKYAAGDTTLERLETEAREAKRGLWTDANPIPPWEWRHRGR
ncbi:MAG: endonuclease [Nitrospiraceae bacterium]|nr:endonuclease [Nitrospiraceae bacterium]